jgi:hypothetical protein
MWAAREETINYRCLKIKLRKILGPKKDYTIIQDLYMPLHIVKTIKIMRLRWAGYVTWKREMRNVNRL